MPTRILRDWTDSFRVNGISNDAEVFFLRLIMKADDFGRFTGHPLLLKASLFPLRLNSVREADISRWIAECVKAGLIALYQAEGKDVVEITEYRQRIKPGQKSRFPENPGTSRQIPEKPAQGGVGGEAVFGGGSGANGSVVLCASPTRIRHETDPPLDASVPTVDEVITYGKGCTPVIPEEYCRDQHARRTADHQWFNGHGKMRDWRYYLRTYYSKDRNKPAHGTSHRAPVNVNDPNHKPW